MLTLALAATLLGPTAPPAGPVPADTRQLLVVVTPSWGATSGLLHRFSRDDSAGAWRPAGEPVDVVVGRSGLGWGLGLHREMAGGPRKAEGDGRAPAGVFRLTDAFGYPPADSIDTGLPYTTATRDLECVDDPASSYYNQVVDRGSVAADWSSHEEMRRRDVLYRRGVVVAHNTDPAVPAGGSCIFLHVWRGPGSTTSGCTAMPEPALTEVMAWLEADSNPVLVQLPAGEYRRLRESWALPGLR